MRAPTITVSASLLVTLALGGCSATPAPSEAAAGSSPLPQPAPGPTVAADTGPTTSAPAPHRLAVGDGHACVVSAKGRVHCWGGNQHGQLGDGTTEDRSTPVRVESLEGIVSIAAGGQDTCAVDASGRVLCWGGIRSQARLVPTPVASLGRARQVSVGDYHACAALVDGTVACWGANDAGQLGTADDVQSQDAVVTVPGLSRVVAVATGHSVSCALRVDGDVLCWGKNGERSSATPVRVAGLPAMRAITLKWEQACGVSRDDEVHCWGATMSGHAHDSPEPSKVEGLGPVRDADLGAFNLCAIGADGVQCVGLDDRPTPVAGFSGYLVPRPVEVSSGNDTTCALAEDGSVRCLGQNSHGQLGVGETNTRATLLDVGGTSSALEVMPASMGGCFLATGGKVECWGFGRPRRESDGHATSPQPLDGVAGAKRLLSGWDYDEVCAATRGGDLYCFRGARPDQAGPRGAPKRVDGVRDVVSIQRVPSYVAKDSAYVLSASGQLLFSRLAGADATGVRKAETTRMTSVGLLDALAVDDRRACAIRRGGTVVCWALDGANGTVKNLQPKVVEIPGVKDAVEIGKSSLYCARTRTAAVVCWALDDFRDNATPTVKAGPTEQASLRGVTSLTQAGPLVLTLPDGTSVCDHDALGGAGWSGADLPLYPCALAPYQSIRNQGSNTCVVRPGGGVACRGRNDGEALASTDRREVSDAVLVKLPADALTPTSK